MSYPKPIKQGLVLRTVRNWQLQQEERMDEIFVYGIPWDNVKLSYAGASVNWIPRGRYESDPFFCGFFTEFADETLTNMIDQKGYYVHMVGVGWFKTLDDYYSFIKNNMQAEIIEEIWF